MQAIRLEDIALRAWSVLIFQKKNRKKNIFISSKQLHQIWYTLFSTCIGCTINLYDPCHTLFCIFSHPHVAFELAMIWFAVAVVGDDADGCGDGVVVVAVVVDDAAAAAAAVVVVVVKTTNCWRLQRLQWLKQWLPDYHYMESSFAS